MATTVTVCSTSQLLLSKVSTSDPLLSSCWPAPATKRTCLRLQPAPCVVSRPQVPVALAPSRLGVASGASVIVIVSLPGSRVSRTV